MKKTITVKITLLEEMLGTASANPEVHEEYIASKGPNAKTREEEVAALGVDEVVEKSMTVFPRIDGKPIIWDYQIKGFFKDACSSMNRVPGSQSKSLKAYKKIIDGVIFPKPRAIEIIMPEGTEILHCQRPLRGQTAQGERIALANSETVPAGSVIQFQVLMLDDQLEDVLTEWLEYGELRGLGQWRNSGKGRFTFEIIR